MQRLLAEDTEKRALLTSAAGMVGQNKRYMVWFWLLNVVLGLFGTIAFFSQAASIFEHMLLSGRLLRGFALGVLILMPARPEIAPTFAPTWAGGFFSGPLFLRTAPCL